jgi:hypothetical protein
MSGQLARVGIPTFVRITPVAPSTRPDRHTISSERDCVPVVAAMIDDDPRLAPCFEQ